MPSLFLRNSVAAQAQSVGRAEVEGETKTHASPGTGGGIQGHVPAPRAQDGERTVFAPSSLARRGERGGSNLGGNPSRRLG